jgi:hypothetical protein
MQEFLSADFLKFFLPLAGGVVGWLLNERRKRQSEEYIRREERYRALLLSLRGFYAGAEDHKLKQEFTEQLSLSWLYCSDEVILRANALLQTLKAEVAATDDEKNSALAELIVEMRRDLLSRNIVRRTHLTGREFEKISISVPTV